nr:hypothetical protein RVX_2347 [Nitratidesulfovibrio sp. HK-II]
MTREGVRLGRGWSGSRPGVGASGGSAWACQPGQPDAGWRRVGMPPLTAAKKPGNGKRECEKMYFLHKLNRNGVCIIERFM